MADEQVKATYKKYEELEDGKKGKLESETEFTVSYEFGDDIDEMVELFGAPVVHSQSRAQMRIVLQQQIRSWAAQGKTADEINDLASNWTPTVGKSRGRSKIDKVRELLKGLTEDQIAEILASNSEDDDDDEEAA